MGTRSTEIGNAVCILVSLAVLLITLGSPREAGVPTAGDRDGQTSDLPSRAGEPCSAEARSLSASRGAMHDFRREIHPFFDVRSVITGPLWNTEQDTARQRVNGRKPRHRMGFPPAQDGQPEFCARLLDAEHMLDLFRRELPIWTASSIRVTRCRVEREESSDRLLVVYKLGVEDPDGGERELALIGVAPTMPESVAQVRDPLAKSLPRLAAYLPDLKAAVFGSLLDPMLPALAEITGPQGAALLAPHLVECGAGARIERIEAELKHHKPLRRAVLRVTATFAGLDPAPAARSLYVKVFRDERGEAIHRDLAGLWAAAQRSTHLRVPEPLGYDPRWHMLVMDEVAGEPTLGDWVKRLEDGETLRADELERLARCMGVVVHALRDLQHSGLRLDERRTFETELGRLKADRDLLRPEVGEGTELAERIDRVLARLALLAPKEEALVPAHGAFRHKQIVGDDRALTIIDWDGLCSASHALDAASFLVRLCHKEWGTPGCAPELARLGARFRAELGAAFPALGPRLALYEAIILTDYVLRSFRSKDGGGGAHAVANLAARAERILDRAG